MNFQYNPMATTVIVDLDNCISDDGWRIPKINWGAHDKDLRYHDYHLLAGFDNFDGEWLEAFRRVVVFTARPVLYAALTKEWLQRFMHRPPAHILMRNNGDARSSVDIKRSMLMQLTSMPEYDTRKEDIICAYDDHQGIVSMYQEMGVAAYRRAIHNIDAYVDPKGARHD